MLKERVVLRSLLNYDVSWVLWGMPTVFLARNVRFHEGLDVPLDSAALSASWSLATRSAFFPELGRLLDFKISCSSATVLLA
jgi:hypothetical protein